LQDKLFKMNKDIITTLKKPATSEDKVNDDFELARQNLHDIISAGTQALDKLMQLANQSQNARYYEVLATTMSTMINANKDLLSLQKQIREINKNNDGPSTLNQTQNNLYIGTTQELLALLKGKTNEPTEENNEEST